MTNERSLHGARNWLAAALLAVLLLGLMLAAPPAAKASHIETPAQLKAACEATGTVVLDHPTKIFTVQQTTPLDVFSSCTIVLGSGAKLEAEWMPLRFHGDFAILAAEQTEVSLVKSIIYANSIRIDLDGAGSGLTAKEATLQATIGNLTISVADDGKLTFVDRMAPGPAAALKAAGNISITGGAKLTGLMDETRLEGVNVTLSASGPEAKLDLLKVQFANTGALAITAPGEKSSVSFDESSVSSASWTVDLPGNDSALKMKQTTSFGAGMVASFRVGGPSATGASIELSEVRIIQAASVTVHSAVGGTFGKLKVEKSFFTQATGPVRVETGASGETAVIESAITSSGLARIAAGAGGKCETSPNMIITGSPVERCLGF